MKDEDVLKNTKVLTLDDLSGLFQSDEKYSKDDIKIEYTQNLKTPEEPGKVDKKTEPREYARVHSNKEFVPEDKPALPEWDGSKMAEDYFKDKYDGTFYRLKNILLKLTLLILAIFGILLVISGILSYKGKMNIKFKSDITYISKLSEEDIEKNLGLKFDDDAYYTKKVPVKTDDDVLARADKGIAVIYIDGAQQGVYLDTDSYKFYNYTVGDSCDSKFEKLKFEYTDVHTEVEGRYTGTRDIYYLFNRKTDECLVMSLDRQKEIVREMGYFYDYKKIIKKYQ